MTLGPWTHSLVFVVMFCAVVDFAKLVIELLGRSEPRRFTCDASQVTAVIPCRNGAEHLPGTVAELSRFLPPERMIVVDDASTDGTGAVARELGCVVHRFPHRKGKASAIHYAIHRVTTPLTLLLDDDTRMGGAQVPTSLITEDGYDAVAFHVLPDRRDRDGARGNNFLGALQRYEYGKSMEIGKRFQDVTNSVCCVSGAVGLFKTADLHRDHHAHTDVFPGEDLQRAGGKHPLALKKRIVGVDDARGVGLAAEQGPNRLALTADMIAVFARQQIKPEHLEVLPGCETLVGQESQWNQRRLRRIRGTHRDSPSLEIGGHADHAAG
jgi:hypothetical protein